MISENQNNTSTTVSMIASLLSFLILLVLFSSALQETAYICWTRDDYSHGLLLPVISGFMVWSNRGSFLDEQQTSSQKKKGYCLRSLIFGFLLLLSGLFLLIFGESSGISWLSWVGFFPAFLGLSLLICGYTITRAIAIPVLLLFMAKPLPDTITLQLLWPLQVLAAKASYFILDTLGVPVYLRGNIIELPDVELMVEEACSGMRSVISLLALSIVILFFLSLPWFSRILLVISSVILALGINIFRIAFTGLLVYFYDAMAAVGLLHTFSGLFVFIIGLPFLCLIAYFLNWITGVKEPQ